MTKKRLRGPLGHTRTYEAENEAIPVTSYVGTLGRTLWCNLGQVASLDSARSLDLCREASRGGQPVTVHVRLRPETAEEAGMGRSRSGT